MFSADKAMERSDCFDEHGCMTTTAALASRQDEYETDGIVQIDGLLSEAEAATIREAFMRQIEEDRSIGATDEASGEDILARFPRFMQPHRRTELEVGRIARKLMLDERIVGVVESLVGPVWGAQSMFYFKPPTARGQAMHQDNYFLKAHPETCIAAWVSIDDCDEENGALSVVPGTHNMEVVCPEEADAEVSFTSTEVRPPEGMTAVQTRMRAGDVLFFHGSLVHGSLPNTSRSRFRRSLIFHYVPKGSVEIAKYYLPLIDPATGEEVSIDPATGGGPCGVPWEGSMH